MSDRQFIAPKPEVLHLTTLFRRIEAGEIRVPRFQRPFVWSEKNVIDLLESVYRGYPVGSLLFWRPNSEILLNDVPDAFGLEIAASQSFRTYVLDGQQRLTTLYRCFFRAQNAQAIFDVLFHLPTETFAHVQQFRGDAREVFPLSTLFSARDFLRQQQMLLSLENGDALGEAAIRLHSRFQEYMIPAVTIEGRDLSEVVEIFERVNRTGTTLSAVDFMRAVTWSSEFDLQREVEALARKCAEMGFVVSDETLVKLVAIAAGRDPTAEDMVRLRQADLKVLARAVQVAERSSEAAISFLRENLHIASYEFVPYEAQFLVICKAFQSDDPPRADVLSTLVRWYWVTSFNESLRGSPDHVVARLVRSVGSVSGMQEEFLVPPLSLTNAALKSRRFLQGRALSSALATLFAVNSARSVLTGEILPVESYMEEFASLHYRPLIPDMKPARVLANMFLCLEEEWPKVRSLGGAAKALEALRGRNSRVFLATLESQMVSSSALEYLIHGDFDAFLDDRAETLLTAARRVVG